MQEVMEEMTTAPWSSLGLPPVGQGDRHPVGGPVTGAPAGRAGSRRRRSPPRRWGRRRGRCPPPRRRRALLDRLRGPDVLRQDVGEGGLGGGQVDAVLRALGPGDGRHHGGQVELEVLGELRLPGRVVPEALLLGVGLDERDLLRRPPGQPQVVDRHLVDGEDRRGGAELRAHVADGGAVGQRHLGHAVAVELHELAHHAVLAEHLGDRQHDVGGGGAGGDGAGEP